MKRYIVGTIIVVVAVTAAVLAGPKSSDAMPNNAPRVPTKAIPPAPKAPVKSMPGGASGSETLAKPSTGKNCVSAGGTEQTVGGQPVCVFSASSCPSGWTKNQNWTGTVATTCDGATTICSGGTSCTTGSHGWLNKAPETCSYMQERWSAGGLEAALWGCGNPAVSATCSASINKIACN